MIGTGNYIDDIDAFIEDEKTIIDNQYRGTISVLATILIISIIIG